MPDPDWTRSCAEEAAEAQRNERETSLIRVTVISLAILLGLVSLALGAGYLIYGRERRADYHQRYEHAPPSNDGPALVNALLAQGPPDEQAFTAVMFDFIRRDILTAVPVQVERATWMGLKKEMISDLEIGRGEADTSGLTSAEVEAFSILDRVVSDGPLPLSQFRTAIRDSASSNHSDYVSFQADTKQALLDENLLDERGRYYPLLVALGLIVVVVLGWFIAVPWVENRGTPTNGVVARAGLVGVGVVGLILIVIFGSQRRIWVRRTPAGALLAARWLAFQRYLQDFSRIEEAPPLALALWEDYLVYGITLGVADDVLEAGAVCGPRRTRADLTPVLVRQPRLQRRPFVQCHRWDLALAVRRFRRTVFVRWRRWLQRWRRRWRWWRRRRSLVAVLEPLRFA